MNDLRFLDIPTQSTVQPTVQSTVPTTPNLISLGSTAEISSSPTAESPNDQTPAIPADLVNLEESQPSTTENQPNEELCNKKVPCSRRSTRIKTRPGYLSDYVTVVNQIHVH